MNYDLIGYRYSRDELATLMLLLKIPSLPGLTPWPLDEDTYQRSLSGLMAAGIAAGNQEQVFIDRLSTLLLRSIANAEQWLCIRSETRDTLLYKTPRLCILADIPRRGACTLTPLQQSQDAESPLKEALERHSAPVTLESLEGTGSFSSLEAAALALAEAFKSFCSPPAPIF